jgi:hypothetical protein
MAALGQEFAIVEALLKALGLALGACDDRL